MAKLAQSVKEQSPVWQMLVFQTLGEATATGFRMSYRLAQRHRLGHLCSVPGRGREAKNRRIMILNYLKTILRELKSLSKQHYCMTRQGKYDRISSNWSFYSNIFPAKYPPKINTSLMSTVMPLPIQAHGRNKPVSSEFVH